MRAATEPQRTQKHSAAQLGVGAIGVAVALLSIGSTMVKSSGLPGPVAAFWRLVAGALAWNVILAVMRSRKGEPKTISRSAIRKTFLLGVLFSVNLALFYTAVTKTSIAHTEFIGSLTPLIVVPFARKRLGERVPVSILGFAAVALCGLALIIATRPATTSAPPRLLGDLLVLGSSATWAMYLLVARSVRSTIGTSELMTGMTTAAAITMLPIVLVLHADKLFDVNARAALLVVTMAFTSGIVSHGMISWAQRRLPISTISIMQTAQPGLASFWAWFFLDQGVAPLQVLGMLIVIGAIGAVAWISSRG